MRRIGLIILPLSLVVVLVILLFRNPQFLRDLRTSWTTGTLPYAILAVAGLLAWRFNKSMLAMLCVFLVILHLGLTRVYALGPCAEHFRTLSAIATPIFFAWFYLSRERGVFNAYGLVRLLVMFVALLLLAAVTQFFGQLPSNLLPGWFVSPVSPRYLPLPRLAVLLFCGCWILLVYPSTRRDPVYGSLLGGILSAVFVAFWVISPDLFAWEELGQAGNRVVAGLVASSLSLSAAGTLALFAVFEISHGTAFVDPLTQLLGRRALDYRLATLSGTYSIAMVDIDHFKRVNDRHGHDVGDQALRFIAARLRQARGGRAYRYGGEEFAIVYPGMSVDQVEPVLNALRESINKSKFYLRDRDRPASKLKGARKRNKKAAVKRDLTLSVSIGVADSIGEVDGPSDVILDADKALYKAKKAGRNRVVASRRRKLDVSRVLRKG